MKNNAFKITFYRFSCALFVLLTSLNFSFATTISWTGGNGAIGNDWNKHQNWSPAVVPTITDSVVIGNLSITQQPSILAGATGTCKSITIGGVYSSILTVSGNLTVSNVITVNSNGILNQATGTNISANIVKINSGAQFTQTGSPVLTITGDISCAGTLNTDKSTVYLPASQTISGTNLTYYNLVLGLGTTTAAASLTVNNSLTFNLGSTLDLTNYTLGGTLSSIVNTLGGGSLKTQNTSSTSIPSGLTWPISVYYNSTGTQTIIDGTYSNLYASGGNRTFSANGNITISNVFNPGSGTYTVTGSTVVFNGTLPQSIPSCSFHNLKISNAAGVSLTGPVSVQNSLGFGNVNNSILTTNGYLTLASSASATANLLDITNSGVNTGNSISGLVTVERFIPAKRAYRFLSAPVISNSIRANWMEGVNNNSTSTNNNPAPGYGTHITGSGGSSKGFDATGTNNPSLFTFDNTSQTWVPASNTSILLNPGAAYRMMVRGSRSVNLADNAAVSSTTTLRATGILLTGDVKFTKAGGVGTAGMPTLSAVAGKYSFIANPYPSDVDYDTLAKTDLDSSIYIFDPTISGSYGRGGYVAYNTFQRRNSNSSSQVNNHIQSGQAFFVQTKGPNPSLTFKEISKATIQRSVFRTTNDIPNMSVQLLLPGQVNSTGSADGTAVYFSRDYNNGVCGDDSYKFGNQDENIAILRGGQTLSLEGRKPIAGNDSVPLKIWQLSGKSYMLKIALENFSDDIEGYLVDKYLNTTTPLNKGETLVPLNITSDVSSAAADRFTVLFETLATLPVRLTGVKAYAKNKGVQVEWVAESESNMDLYEVERSTDAQHFETIGSAKAKNTPGIASGYNFFDVNPVSGDSYYRIKAIEKSGDTKLSEVVKVQIADPKNTISVTNNPTDGNAIKLMFDNAEKGNYSVGLFNSLGEKVYTGKVAYPGGTSFEEIKLNVHLPSGIYQLQLNNSSFSKALQILVR